jgi:hypothetical protein
VLYNPTSLVERIYVDGALGNEENEAVVESSDLEVSHPDVRAFLQSVADEFTRLSKSKEASATLEPANAGTSFERDAVRATFRVKQRHDVNAVGIIVTAKAVDAAPTDVSPVDIARRILKRLEAIDVTELGGMIARVGYQEVPLSDIIYDVS